MMDSKCRRRARMNHTLVHNSWLTPRWCLHRTANVKRARISIGGKSPQMNLNRQAGAEYHIFEVASRLAAWNSSSRDDRDEFWQA